MIQSKSAAHAKKYYTDALAKSDYYIGENQQELPGRFIGKLSDRLGITGLVDRDTFFAMCDNVSPATGGNLTPRTKEERTTGYDINFHSPKSVSIIDFLAPDSHVREAFESSVIETLQEIETDSMTRVRKNGECEDRRTGELSIGLFTHLTARPVDDLPPDPHLHAHAYVFNATFDPIENQIKAGQFRDTKRDMPYYEKRFHKRLSDKLIDQGYGIRLTDRAFEIEHVPQSVIDLFSKRKNEVEKYAKAHGITDAKELDELGAITRGKKQSGLSMDELKALWYQQIKDNIVYAHGEAEAIIRHNPKVKENKIATKDCINHTLEHSFERQSVVQDRRLLASGIRHSIGERHISIEDIEAQFKQDPRIINVQQGHLNYCTTKTVLAEEKQMVNLARKGLGKFRPLYDKTPEIKYDGAQGAAIEHVLTTSNQVCIIRGVAGAGKTTSLVEIDRLIKEAGKETFIVTPMAQTAREQLPIEGFKNATTVAALINDKKLQANLKGQVLIIDEAGQLGTGDMSKLLSIADQQNARLLLVGDTRQHNAVQRGDALRVINTIGGIQTAEVNKIYRQRNNPQYLAAVEDLSNGQIEAGFEKLDAMGAIKTIDPMEPNKELVADYIKTIKKGKSALIVSPTHLQGKSVTDDIRTELRKSGMIGKRETTVTRLENLNLTEAEKSDWRSYVPGQMIKFNQNMPKIPRGSRWELDDVQPDSITIKNVAGESQHLPLNQSKKFTVFRQTEIGLSKGDEIRITDNGFDLNDKRLNNGQAMKVLKVTKEGNIFLKNPISKATYAIGGEFGHIDHGYCSTSHSAQGKTVDAVYISQPADTFPATNAKQLYVSVSRGKENVTIYTDDKEKLLDYASQLGDRKSAMELVGDDLGHEDYIIQHELNKVPSAPKDKIINKNYSSPELNNYFEHYEPGL